MSQAVQYDTVSKYGKQLVIDSPHAAAALGPVVAVDVETDEKDNVVCVSIHDGSDKVYVQFDHTLIAPALAGKKVVGFNLKAADLDWLKSVGVDIKPDDIVVDVMVQVYSIDSTVEHMDLKSIARHYLGMVWKTYREMVGKGRAKITLDKQDKLEVAEYTGMDVLATWQLYKLLEKKMTPPQKRICDTLEMPVYRMLYEMETHGVMIDTVKLAALDQQFTAELGVLEWQLQDYDKDFNPRSPDQVKELLHAHRINVPDTAKATLKEYAGHPLVDLLLRHRTVSKLHSTYIKAFKAIPSLPIIHTTFNQVAQDRESGGFKGIRTGRLSSSGPNLQNIAASGDGEVIRELFIPRPGYVLLDFDYSQIEYRLLAHLSREPGLISGFMRGDDAHTITAGLLFATSSPTKDQRKIGKTINFASIYGAQAKKIASNLGISEQKAQEFLDAYWAKLPNVTAWVQKIKYEARTRKGVQTMCGRWIPLPGIVSKNKWDRLHYERASVNYIIQGSAADIIKVAMLQLKAAGYMPVLQVHDELLFEVKPEDVAKALREIKSIMEGVVTLAVPLIVDGHEGENWREAKEGKKAVIQKAA
jgi:DNA polymerase-1